MSRERSAYMTRVVNPVEAALPGHAHIDDDSDRRWTATWTTPDGVWSVAWRDPNTEATTLTVTGPLLLLRLEYPSDATLALHVLIARHALDPAPSAPSASEEKAEADERREIEDAARREAREVYP